MRKIRWKYFYRIGAVLSFLTLGSLIFYNNNDEIGNQQKIKIIERSIRSPLNQDECRIPVLPVKNPDIMIFYNPVSRINCGDASDDWVKCEKSICFVKPQIIASHGTVTCSYTDLIRKSDYSVKYGGKTTTKDIYVLQASDFVKVACISETKKTWIGYAYGIRDSVDYAVPKAEIAIPINNMLNQLSNDDAQIPTYFNVLMFGFDSMSRNAVIRTLPKTFEYLTGNLGAIVLQGYNIVGDGTPQALIPLLTGYTELELPETRRRMPNAQPVDVYPMIWKEFKRYGYLTSFNEDVPSIGTFTYRMKGFVEQPVDHYLRTFYIEVPNMWSENFCIGHQPDHVVMLDYTKNFMAKYTDAPRFVFSFHGGLSHDSINMIGVADDDVRAWLHDLKTSKILDNTILIFMADHGSRYSMVRETVQGKLEERLPFFSFTFPEAFKKRFPQQYANFIKNAERLTTPFDIHATLQHLLKLQQEDINNEFYADDAASDIVDENSSSKDDPILISKMAQDRAISLFDVIPNNRSCADAYIEPHWCACLNWQQLELSDESYKGLALKLAGSILNAINDETNDYRSKCAELTLNKINWIMRLLPRKELLRFKGNKDPDGFIADMSDKAQTDMEMYQLQIVTNPGESLFEASVTYDLKELTAVTKLSEISRINEYGKQANCIYDVNPELRKYCYCKK